MSASSSITDWLDGQRDAQTAFLRELVKVPSDNPPGDCAPSAERAVALLEALGFEVERHPVPEETCRANGMISATNLIVRRRFGPEGAGGPVIALNAHGDVVAPGEGWSCDPYGGEIREGWLYGRGAAVSKSDFATYAYALKALERDSAGLRGTVELHFTYDEEVGGVIGPKWLIEQGLSRPDLAICAGFSYAVVTAHNGCLHLDVEPRGRSAHAARPDTGVDALEVATAALGAVYELRHRLAERRSGVAGIETPTLVVGLISGGINTNVVPDRASFRIDRRIIPEESLEAAETELVATIREAVAPWSEASVEIAPVLKAAPLTPLPGVADPAERLRARAASVFGCEIAEVGLPLYTDARHYAEAGIPTLIYGAGPRSLTEANAHRADERLPLEDLYKATRVMALTLHDLLSDGGGAGAGETSETLEQSA